MIILILLYFVSLDQIYLYKHNNHWNTFNDRCFIQPIKNNDDKIVDKEAINMFTKLLATRIPPIVCSRSSLAFLILLFLFESDN